MPSLANGFTTLDCVLGRNAGRTWTEAEEANIILAILLAFLAGGITLALRAMSLATAWVS